MINTSTVLSHYDQVATLKGYPSTFPTDALDIVNGHIVDHNNPHAVTAAQVGAYSSSQVDDAIINAASTLFHNVKWSGAKGDGRYVADAVTTAGSATLASATAAFTPADIGKTVYVKGAGAAGVPLVTTISAVNPNGLSVTLATPAGTPVAGGKLYYGTDDTAAIQAAINTVYAAGGGRIFFPRGIYMISGAVTVSESGRAQIHLPYAATTGDKIVILLQGEFTGGELLGYQQARQTTGTILFSTLTGGTYDATYGPPAIIGGPTGEQTGMNDAAKFSHLYFCVKDINFRQSANPSYVCLHAEMFATVNFEHIRCDTTEFDNSVPLTTPTHHTGVGIWMPGAYNNGRQLINHVFDQGYYCGRVLGEHSNGTDLISVQCVIGNGLPLSNVHAIHLGYVETEWCNYGFSGYTASGVTPGTVNLANHVPMTVGLWDIEDATAGWCVPINHFRDGTFGARGQIAFLRIIAGQQAPSEADLTTPGCGILFFNTAIPGHTFMQVKAGVSDIRGNQGASNATPTLSAQHTSGKAIAMMAGANGTQIIFDRAGYLEIGVTDRSKFTSNSAGDGTETILARFEGDGRQTFKTAVGTTVVALTDAATIATNSDLGNIFAVTLGGNRTMSAPTGTPADGRLLVYRIRQDATGSRTITWVSAFRFSGGTAPTLTTTAAKTDYIGFRWNATDSKWDHQGASQNI